jgi:hypothetical protein
MVRSREETDYKEAEVLNQNSKKNSRVLKKAMEARNTHNPQALEKNHRKDHK